MPVSTDRSAGKGKSIPVALVSDPHCTQSLTGGQRFFRGRFDKVIEAVNAANPAMVLIAGDLTHRGTQDEVEQFRAQAARFEAPVRYVYGNHDVGAKHFAGDEDGVTAERVDRMEQSLGPSFWTHSEAGVRVVGVNGSLFGSGLAREQDQWEFLERVMVAQPELTLLLVHYPLFLETPDEPGGDYWNIEPLPRARLFALLHRGGVRVVLSGHVHYPLVLAEDGIVHVTTPPVSFGLPRESQPEGWTLVSVNPFSRSVRARTLYLPKEEFTG